MGRRKYNCNDGLFSEPTERGAYWLGFCVADGHVESKRGNEVQLQLAAKDRCQLEGFKQALETDRPIYDYWNRRYPKSGLYITSPELASVLLGFDGNSLRQMAPELHNHFVRGLFDGDGTVNCKDYERAGRYTQYNRKVSICGTQDILSAVAEVASVSGISKGCLSHLRGIYAWSLGGIVNMQQFEKWLYHHATIFLPRKREGFVLLDRQAVSKRRSSAEIRH